MVVFRMINTVLLYLEFCFALFVWLLLLCLSGCAAGWDTFSAGWRVIRSQSAGTAGAVGAEGQKLHLLLNGKFRQGIRRMLLGSLMCVLIAAGADWLLLYIVTAGVFLSAIIKLAQGCMDVF